MLSSSGAGGLEIVHCHLCFGPPPPPAEAFEFRSVMRTVAEAEVEMEEWPPTTPLARRAASPRGTPSFHHKICLLAGPTLGKYYGITYQQKVPGPPNPWNKSCAENCCDPNWL